MLENIEEAKDIALLILGGIACFGLSFLFFVVYGDFIKRRKK